MCQAGPRWRPNREIAWYTEGLLPHVRYTNSKRSPSSNAISSHVDIFMSAGRDIKSIKTVINSN